MNYVVGLIFVAGGSINVILGALFIVNARDVGTRYIRWYRRSWSWKGGFQPLRGPRATNAVARASGALWLATGLGAIAVGVSLFP